MDSSLKRKIPAITLIRTVINTVFRMVYPFLPAISRGLGISLEEAARALSLRSMVGVFGPFLASVSDSRGRKTGMLVGLGLFSASLLIVVFWPTFWGFTLTLALTTLAKFTFDPALQAYLGDRVPYQQRGRILAFIEFGWSGAFFLGVPLAGFIIARFGWLAPFPLLAFLGLLSFFTILRILPADPPPASGQAGMLSNFRAVFTYFPAIAALLMVVSVSVANEVVNLVFGAWLEDSFALQVTALGSASAVIGLSEVFGEGLVSLYLDRLGKRRAIMIGLVCNSLASLALPLLGRTVPGAVVGLFIFYLSFEFTFVSMIPLMTEVLPSARATLMAVSIASTSLGRALAAWLAPVLYFSGFTTSALAAALINLLALLALQFVRISSDE